MDELTAPDQPAGVRALGIAALAQFDLQQAAELAVPLLAQVDSIEDAETLLDPFLQRREGSGVLATVVRDASLPEDAAKLALRHMYSVGRVDESLSAAFSAAAGLSETPPTPTKEELQALVEEVRQQGDPQRGEQIFRRADLSCQKCHAVSKAGGQIGPELSAVGASSPPDYLLMSILDPDQQIKEAFVTKVILTVDGLVHQGIVADHTDERVVLRDATGKTVSIPTADIEEEIEGKSLMPKGLVKFLTHEELIDLAAFLSELGKPGRYAVRTTPRMQRWRVLTELPEFPPQPGIPLDPNFAELPHWQPAYALVNGELPLPELAERTEGDVLYVQGEVDVVATGEVALEFDSVDGLAVWVDDQPLNVSEKNTVQLAEGRHSIFVRIDPSAREKESLKLELSRPDGSNAQFAVVDGA